jgi:serine/threonine protein kinase/tetratricopeptide (TPR) repeat protein
MKPERYRQVKEVFAAAVGHGPDSRAEFLARACAGDAGLRAEVESLLEHDEAAEGFIEESAFDVATRLMADGGSGPLEGRRVGPYKILREVGRGGMGVVYLAERDDERFRQRVAIKVVKRGLDTDDILHRFRHERQILASLDHPNIARLFDGGETEDGRPYFVMEYVEGVPLMQYCDEQDLSTEARLKLFRTVCSAVQHAHQNLVVHRDLKPSNILVARGGEPKLLDFGVAKLLNPEQAGGMTETQWGRAMTPEYASPEQVSGGHVTTATDVYSLGVILYELLTGVRPYELKGLSGAELSRAICGSEPSKPSRAAASHQSEADEERWPAFARLLRRGARPAPSLRGDVDNIVLKALRKDPAERYGSAGQFSEDIGRHLAGLPVHARPATLRYRASKFVARNLVAVGAACLVFAVVVAGLVLALWQAENARRQRDAAQRERVKAERVSAFLSTALSYSDPSAAGASGNNRRDATINQMLDDMAPQIESELPNQPEVRASLESTIGSAYLAQTRMAEAEHYLNSALDTQLRLYGEGSAETGRTILALGNMLNVKGDFDAAAVTARRAIAIFRSLRREGTSDADKQLAEALLLYGDVMWTKGDYAASESAYTECLSLASLPQVNDQDFAASARAGLGFVRYAQGQLAESATLLREVVAAYHASPRARWRLGAVLNFLGQVLTHQGKYDEALAVLDEGEAVSREQWGENSFDFSRSLLLRAYALCYKGDYADAGRTLSREEELVARNFPDDKVTEANVYDVRGMILTRTGRAREGEAAARRATELYQGVLVRGANGITLSRMHWAESLTAQRRYAEAEKLLLDAYGDANEVQGAGHLRTRQAALELVRLYEVWGKPDLAAQYRPAAAELITHSPTGVR